MLHDCLQTFTVFYNQIRMKNYCWIIVLSLITVPVWSQTVQEPKPMSESWNKPYEPFRIAGNLYYVGTYDLACYLITTPQGHILINTGLAASASQIEANVEKLGFRFSDIKILLTTQAHHDHMGAMAAIKKKTGAQMMVNEKDAPVMADGGVSDFAFGSVNPSFAPVKPDRLLHPNEVIQLGDMQLTMLHHPGHTKGSCSYLFTVADDQRSYRVLIANMPTIVVDGKLDEIESYPTIIDDLAATFQSMKDVTFDLWVASHASQFGLHTRRKPGDAYNPSAFMDRAAYDAALTKLEQSYRDKLK